MKAVILANGAFPTLPCLLDELRRAEFLAVCDGAVVYLEPLGIEPSVIIGDLDSIPWDLREKYGQKIIHISEQSSNDLSKAFYHCLSLGFDEFVILGATGKREDHSIANISLLTRYAKECKNVVLKSDFGTFSVHQTPCIVSSVQGEQISLFCLNPSARFTSWGLKYPLQDLSLPLWANGTLNEALGERFGLSSEGQSESVIIYQAR